MSEVTEAAQEFVEKMTDTQEEPEGSSSPETGDSSNLKMTMEERKAKMEELRRKMVGLMLAVLPPLVLTKVNRPQRTSALENRKQVVEENTKAKFTAREAARLERQRKLAETLRLKADAEDRGEDVERAKNWEYTVEENDEWEKKQARKARRADFEFHSESLPAMHGGVASAENGRNYADGLLSC